MPRVATKAGRRQGSITERLRGSVSLAVCPNLLYLDFGIALEDQNPSAGLILSPYMPKDVVNKYFFTGHHIGTRWTAKTLEYGIT